MTGVTLRVTGVTAVTEVSYISTNTLPSLEDARGWHGSGGRSGCREGVGGQRRGELSRCLDELLGRFSSWVGLLWESSSLTSFLCLNPFSRRLLLHLPTDRAAFTTAPARAAQAGARLMT